MMETAVSHMGTAGYLEATLWVLRGNDRAIDFYLAMGFQSDHLTKNDVVGDGFPITELRYRKVLRRTRKGVLSVPAPPSTAWALRR